MNSLTNPANHIQAEYKRQADLFDLQPTLVKRYIETQAKVIASSFDSKSISLKFQLPDKAVLHLKNVSQPVEVAIPSQSREVKIGGLGNIFGKTDLFHSLVRKLSELEQTPDTAISACGSLLRYATATHLVHQVLPSGKMVQYAPLPDEIIPTVPVGDASPESAITQATDAITEEGDSSASRGELQTPFVPAQRLFFLPQWVSFEPDGRILSPVAEAEANLRSMQNYVSILHRASSIAPYIVADEEYQRKRYGILGQLINQGRALATFRTQEIIAQVKERANTGTLNRGLSLSLPYFDDQDLLMRERNFEVIPAGRIQFVPAFVVRAVREELAKVEQDTRLNKSTRSHLIINLLILHDAFLQ